MKRTIALAVITCILWPVATSALNRQKAQYVGGNIASIRLKTTGTLSTNAADVIVFTPDKKGQPPLRVSYGVITSLDYSKRAGRGFGVSIRLTNEAATPIFSTAPFLFGTATTGTCPDFPDRQFRLRPGPMSGWPQRIQMH